MPCRWEGRSASRPSPPAADLQTCPDHQQPPADAQPDPTHHPPAPARTQDPRTGVLPRLLGALALAYALSPMDLIPDFIPILGLVDDLLLLPGGGPACMKCSSTCTCVQIALQDSA